ncbi:hypothetical protein ABT256_34425 [Amycolatopsis japonica]|uniref:hypothetical protein n=1 Tax=Amycolatopsis japonica TaxID=208439 RepID=UPI003328E1E2
MRALGEAFGALLDHEPTAGAGTVVYREKTGAEVTSAVAITRHPFPARWRVENSHGLRVNDGITEWTVPVHGSQSSRPAETSLLVPFPLYPILPEKAPILGRSTDDWQPVNARKAGNSLVVVTVEKIDQPETTGTLTVDLKSKIIREMDLQWITIEVVDWSSAWLPEPNTFNIAG